MREEVNLLKKESGSRPAGSTRSAAEEGLQSTAQANPDDEAPPHSSIEQYQIAIAKKDLTIHALQSELEEIDTLLPLLVASMDPGMAFEVLENARSSKIVNRIATQLEHLHSPFLDLHCPRHELASDRPGPQTSQSDGLGSDVDARQHQSKATPMDYKQAGQLEKDLLDPRLDMRTELVQSSTLHSITKASTAQSCLSDVELSSLSGRSVKSIWMPLAEIYPEQLRRLNVMLFSMREELQSDMLQSVLASKDLRSRVLDLKSAVYAPEPVVRQPDSEQLDWLHVFHDAFDICLPDRIACFRLLSWQLRVGLRRVLTMRSGLLIFRVAAGFPLYPSIP